MFLLFKKSTNILLCETRLATSYTFVFLVENSTKIDLQSLDAKRIQTTWVPLNFSRVNYSAEMKSYIDFELICLLILAVKVFRTGNGIFYYIIFLKQFFKNILKGGLLLPILNDQLFDEHDRFVRE